MLSTLFSPSQDFKKNSKKDSELKQVLPLTPSQQQHPGERSKIPV
jgi:hypothetical protein